MLANILPSIPSHGSLTGTLPSLTYTPDSGFTGDDTLTYRANDGTADGPTSTVSIHVSPRLVQIGSGSVGAGDTITLPITVPSEVSGLTSLELTLAPQASNGAGAPSPSWDTGTDTAGWLFETTGPWNFKVSDATGVSGPAQVMTLSVQVPPTAPSEPFTPSVRRWRSCKPVD